MILSSIIIVNEMQTIIETSGRLQRLRLTRHTACVSRSFHALAGCVECVVQIPAGMYTSASRSTVVAQDAKDIDSWPTVFGGRNPRGTYD